MTEFNEEESGTVGLRDKIFHLDPADIGLAEADFGHPVWGMVMETGYSDFSYTLLVLAEGTVSLYLSNGGGIIGGGEHDSVREVAGHFLSAAQAFYTHAKPVTDFPVPADGEVRFYFLTYNGVQLYSGQEEVFGNDQDDLSQLFYIAHGVISELRMLETDPESVAD
ncbi:MAG: hypothetical protein OEZ39_17005 [Gammaproteobacteria bacterium]|nr:hypothetical protein [Gammaproteobacteria bacterium]MDH5653561.1 hypothetical protein [Gammaproteobacteria bacterium]